MFKTKEKSETVIKNPRFRFRKTGQPKQRKKRTESGDSAWKIFRAIEWPSFPSAIRDALLCILASAVCSGALYLVDYAVNQAVAYLT